MYRLYDKFHVTPDLTRQSTRALLKDVVFLLGDEDKSLKVWKVGGLAECQVWNTSHSE